MIHKNGYGWEIDGMDASYIKIMKGNSLLFRIFVGEVLDTVGREIIETHIKEIENSPWIDKWHKV